MTGDDGAELVLLASALALAAERGLTERLFQLGLRPAQFRLLFAIHLEARRRLEGRAGRSLSADEALSVPFSDVMRVLGGVRASSVSSAVRGLPEGTIIFGTPTGRDARFTSLELSEGGRELTGRASVEASLLGGELMSALSVDERRTLLRLLRACVDALFPPSSGLGG